MQVVEKMAMSEYTSSIKATLNLTMKLRDKQRHKDSCRCYVGFSSRSWAAFGGVSGLEK